MNEPKFIIADLMIEDTCNPCNDEALEHVREILSEAFGKEEMKEHPRCKLLLMKVNFKYKKEDEWNTDFPRT